MTSHQAQRLITELLRDGDLHDDCGICAERTAPILARLDANEGVNRVLRAVYVWCAMAAAAQDADVVLVERGMARSHQPPWFGDPKWLHQRGTWIGA